MATKREPDLGDFSPAIACTPLWNMPLVLCRPLIEGFSSNDLNRFGLALLEVVTTVINHCILDATRLHPGGNRWMISVHIYPTEITSSRP